MRRWIRSGLAVAGLLVSATAAQAANTADMGVRLTAVSFRNGSTGLYTISVSNAGPSATNDVITVGIALPAGFSMISGGGNQFTCGAAANQVTCTRTVSMSPGTVSFQLRVNVCSQVSRVSTIATISYAGDDNLASNRTSRGTSVKLGPCAPTATPTVTATPTHTPPSTPTESGPTSTATPTATATATTAPTPIATDLSVTVTNVGPFRVGANGTYFIVVGNNGPGTTNLPIVVNDPLPNGLSFDSASGQGWSCAAINQNVSCVFSGTLTPSSTTGFTLTVRIARVAAPTTTNVVTVSYDGDTDNTNNTARRPTTVRF